MRDMTVLKLLDLQKHGTREERRASVAEQARRIEERDALAGALTNLMLAVETEMRAQDNWIASGHTEETADAYQDAAATTVIRLSEARRILSRAIGDDVHDTA